MILVDKNRKIIHKSRQRRRKLRKIGRDNIKDDDHTMKRKNKIKE